MSDIKPYEIHITHLGSCPRNIEDTFNGKPESQPHFRSETGRIIHKQTEYLLSGEIGRKIDYGSMLDLASEVDRFIAKPISNVEKWYHDTKLDIDNAILEATLKVTLNAKYVLVGRIDLVTPTMILDFKSGKRRNTKDYRRQLVGYKFLANKQKLSTGEILGDIFLGGDDPVEMILTDKEVKAAKKDFDVELRDHKKILDRVQKGIRMPCKLSMLCAFCSYRGSCRGI